MPSITTTVAGIEYTITQNTAHAIMAALLRIEKYDTALNGTAPDFNDARAPEGEDYNHVTAEVFRVLEVIRPASASCGQMRQPAPAPKTGPYRTKAEIRMDWKRDRNTVWPVIIPAGTRCKLITEGSTAGRFWIDDLSWIEDRRGLLMHDATHYGIDIAPDLVEQT